MGHTAFQTGLVSISFRELLVGEIIHAVQAAGLDGIEWGGDVHVPHGDTILAARVGKQTREAGLEIAAYGSYYRFEDLMGKDGPDPDSVIDTAEALGADMIRIWPGSIGSADASAEWVSQVADRTASLAEKSGIRGMRLGFEFHDHSLTDSAESTLNLLLEIGNVSVTTFWQPYLHTTEADREKSLRQVLPHLSNLHVNFFGDHGWPDVQPLKTGQAAWQKYLEIVQSGGRSHWLTIEHVAGHSLDQFSEDAAVLKGLCDSL